jgi:hypothetical protein
MKQRDYERLAEQCSAQADAMQPGSERDALLTRAKQYRFLRKDGKLDRFEGATAACELVPWGGKLAGCTLAKRTRSAKTLRVFFSSEAKPEPVQPTRVAQ